MKDMEWYFGATYRNIFQTAIMNETLETLPDPEILKTTPDTGAKSPKMDG